MVDAHGKKIQLGGVAPVIGSTDLKGTHPSGRRESSPAFRYLVGKYKRVVGFNHGLIELSFRIRKGKNKGLHAVWIEPELWHAGHARGSVAGGGGPAASRHCRTCGGAPVSISRYYRRRIYSSR